MTDGFLIVVALAGLVTLALKCAFIEGQRLQTATVVYGFAGVGSASSPLCINYPWDISG